MTDTQTLSGRTFDPANRALAPADAGSGRRFGRRPRRWHEASPRARFLTLAGLLLLLTLAVRVVYVLHTHNFHLTIDPTSYDYLARTLAKGHGWGYGTSAYRPPGYPVFLAGVYLLTGLPHAVFTAPRLVEAVLATGTIWLTGLIALQVVGRTAMLFTLAIGALYLPLVLVGVSIMSEALVVPLVLAATNCGLRARTATHRYRWIVAAGFFSGLAALTRGNGMVVGFALAFVVWTGRPWLSRRAILAPALLVAVMVLTIMPWTIRNANAQHAFVPVTTELGTTLGGTYNDRSARERWIWNVGGFKNYQAIKHNRKLSEAENDSQLTSAVLSFIGDHPTSVPEVTFWNTMRLLDLQGRRVSRMTARTDTDATAGVADLGVVIFWIVAALAILGCFTRTARSVPRALWVVPFLLWLSVAPIVTGTPRHRGALDPFVIVLAACGLQAAAAALLHRRSAARSPRTVPAAAVSS